MIETAVTVIAATTIGFLTGLLTFKTKLRWCTQCGTTLRCPHCPTR